MQLVPDRHQIAPPLCCVDRSHDRVKLDHGAGNTLTRTSTTGTAQTLTYNPLGNLDSLTEGANTTSLRYDADGN